MNLSIEAQHVSDGVVRLAIAGEVDLATCEHLQTAIQKSLTDTRTAELIIDLNQVSFLDSTGISALIKGLHLATDRGVRYHVANPGAHVYRVLDLSGVLSVLTYPKAATY